MVNPISETTTLGRRVINTLPYIVTAILVLGGLISRAVAFVGSAPRGLTLALDVLSGFATVFLGIFIEAAPYLLLGTLASGLVEVLVSRDDLAHWIPRRAFGGAVVGGLMGLFFPVCECGVVPFVRRLIRKGLPLPAAISLLLAAPVVNPIVIASTLAAFGPGLIFWGRLGFSLLIAVTVGALFGLAAPKETLLEGIAPEVEEQAINVPKLPKPSLKERLRRMLVIAGEEFFDMGRYLVIGAALAALMQTFIPQSSLLAIGQGPLLSVIAMVLLAVLLSVCSTVDAFIALAFVGAFSSGSILAFLVYGPMVDIKSTLMFLRVFRKKAVLYLVALPLALTVVVGFLVNIL